MDYEIRQKHLDKAAQEYVDLMNGSGYTKKRALFYGVSFLVAPVSTGFLIVEDIICGKPTYSIEVESSEQSRGFSVDSRNDGLQLNDCPKPPVIRCNRKNNSIGLVIPYLCMTLGLGFGLNDLDNYVAEKFDCTKLVEKTEVIGVGLENIVNSCSYEVYKNLESKF